MKRFIVWYSEDTHGKIGFDAESVEEANALMDQVRDGEILPDDLPGYWKKEKNGDFTIGEVEEVES